MSQFADPGYNVHKAMGQYLSLLAYHLATDDLLPHLPVNYADEMEKYYQILRYTVGNSSQPDFDTSALQSAITKFRDQAEQAAKLAQHAVDTNDADLLQTVNHKYRDYQRGFVSQGGLPGREFYKHMIFAPGIDTGYDPVTFPGVTEAVEAKDFETAKEYVEKTARAIGVAGEILERQV
jgi:N-acetylated-alpha-linked acidic dipeptidase